jgi:hypothetical protein
VKTLFQFHPSSWVVFTHARKHYPLWQVESCAYIYEDISYAVISKSGELKSGLGEIPLKIDPTAILAVAETGRATNFDNQIYILVSKPILDSKNKIVGTVVIPGDIMLQQRAVDEQRKFSLALSALVFVVAVLIALYFIGREIARNPHFEKLPEALNTPENLHKEFVSMGHQSQL